MPKKKDLKRNVRVRMKKTGESYTSARAQLLDKQRAASSDAELEVMAGIKNASLLAKTGKDWRQWLGVLDRAGAASKPHREIAKLVHEEHGTPPWWAQTVTVGYERIRGLRDKGQRRGGGFDVNKSKTFNVSLEHLYDAFSAANRRRWLGDIELRIKKATREKSMRVLSADGTPVEIYFWSKGLNKSQVQIQHRGHGNKSAADASREQWSERLQALGEWLSSRTG